MTENMTTFSLRPPVPGTAPTTVRVSKAQQLRDEKIKAQIAAKRKSPRNMTTLSLRPPAPGAAPTVRVSKAQQLRDEKIKAQIAARQGS